MIIYTHPVVSNFPIKTLVARRLQTNKHTHNYAHMHVHTYGCYLHVCNHLATKVFIGKLLAGMSVGDHRVAQ